MKRYFFIFIFIYFFCFQFAIAEVKEGVIMGKVYDNSDIPIVGVTVTLPQLHRKTITNQHGVYRFVNVPTGNYLLVFQIYGYETHRQKVIISKKKVNVNIKLHLTSIESYSITVTGTPYSEDPLISAADVDIVEGRKKIVNQSSNLGETLEGLPGVSNIATGSQVGKPVIRGLSSNRIRILADGIAMDYQQFGVRHWANMDPFLVERIEVVRGASCVLYGSGALGGVINVIPNQIPLRISEKSILRGNLITQYYSNNSEFVGGLTLESAFGNFGLSGTIVGRTAGNMYVPDVKTAAETGISTDPKFTGELDFTDFNQLNGSLGIGYQEKFGELVINYSHWCNEHNFLLPNGKGIGQNIENNVFQIKGLVALGDNWIIKPTLSYIQNLRQSNKTGSPRDQMPDDIVIDLLVKNYTARVQLEHEKLGPFSGQMGIEHLYGDHDTRGTVPLLPAATIHNFAAFVFEEAKLGDLTLSIGARFDVRNQEATPNETLKLPDYYIGETKDVLKQDYSVFTGSIGATYRFTKNLALAANLGRGFRIPSIFELHVYGEHGGIAAFQIGDPNLKEETSLNTDLSIRWRSSRLQAKATIYRNAINNYIYLINTGEFHIKDDGSQIPIMKTIQSDAELIGADASLQTQLFPWLQVRCMYETVKGENLNTDEKLPLLPASKADAEVRFIQKKLGPFKNCWLSISVGHSNKKEAAGRYEPFWQFDLNQNFGIASTEAYTLLDLGIGFDIMVGGQPVTISLEVKNATNEAYRDFLDTYKGYALSPGRNILLKLNFPFNIFGD